MENFRADERISAKKKRVPSWALGTATIILSLVGPRVLSLTGRIIDELDGRFGFTMRFTGGIILVLTVFYYGGLFFIAKRGLIKGIEEKARLRKTAAILGIALCLIGIALAVVGGLWFGLYVLVSTIF